uniref:Uncharacterized protein n=1 Tax=Arundo donax TaxID=35708 RepID=A0A0A9H2G3_ARUDO
MQGRWSHFWHKRSLKVCIIGIGSTYRLVQ